MTGEARCGQRRHAVQSRAVDIRRRLLREVPHNTNVPPPRGYQQRRHAVFGRLWRVAPSLGLVRVGAKRFDEVAADIDVPIGGRYKKCGLGSHSIPLQTMHMYAKKPAKV